MKKCAKCGVEKDFDCFHKDSKSKDLHQSRCKSCCTEYARKHYLKNKQKYLDNMRKRQKTGYFKEWSRKRREKDPEAENRRTWEVTQRTKAKGISCVYTITNTVNGKTYVGETTWKHRRWTQHKKELEKNNHCNPRLQEDYNGFGEEAFVYEIYKEVEKDKDLLVLEEKNAIKDLISQGKEVYNRTKEE